jgi:carboxypeptidase T
MQKFLTFFLLILITIQLSAQTKTIYHRASVSLEGKNISDLGAVGIEIEHGDFQQGRYFTTDFSEQELTKIRQAGFEVEILIENVSNWYKTQSTQKVSLPRNNACEGVEGTLYDYPTPVNYTYGTMGGYYTYQEMLDILEDMHTKYPNLITLKASTSDSLLTHEGHPQYWVKISDNPNVAETEPQIMYTALHHAREPNGLSQMIFYMWHLLENYDTDPEIQHIVNNLEMYFVPCVNPDGYIFNVTNDPDGGGLWRKNRRNNDDGTFGVDLNRNYGHEWGFNNQGSSPNSNSDIYRGPSAFSEPETRMLRDFCLAHDFKITLNYHTFSNLLIYPWGFSDALADSTFFKIGHLLTRENHYKTGTSSETVGYQVNGTADDWMYAGAQIFSMTPEVGPASWGFWPPADGIDFLNKSALTQNLLAAKCILRFGEATDKSAKTVFNLDNNMPVEVTRYGFESGVFQVTLAPLSSNILSVSGAQTFDLQQFESKNGVFQYALNPTIQFGEEVKFLLEINNGAVSHIDTLTKVFGASAQSLLSETGTNMNNWVTDNWNISSTYFVSPPTSITDSPNGDYAENQFNQLVTATSVLIPTNAQSANLRFQARWVIEQDWDYVQVLASTDNVNWTPLCGDYTNLGINTQPNDQPLYDGSQFFWVEETMDLSTYIGQNVWIRFDLISDGFLQLDGFYFDDLRIDYTSLVGTNVVPLQNFELSQNKPNPAIDVTIITWSASENTNFPDGNLLIYNALNQVVFEKKIDISKDGKVNVNTKNWQQGTYFYQIQNGEGVSKMMKMVVIP